MDDLPELPFEKVLSYLSLSELIKARAVSKSWRMKIDSFRPKSLCCSERPRGFIMCKSRWVSGAFDQNFICSARPNAFIITFRKSILSNLKRLGLFNLNFKTVRSTGLIAAANLFPRLEELVIIGITTNLDAYQYISFELNLPMLNSIHIESLAGIAGLTLNTPRLLKIHMLDCAHAQLEIVHGESVEWLFVDGRQRIEIKQLKKLKYLYTNDHRIDRMLLSSLEELREVHLQNSEYIPELQQDCCNKIVNLFEQKQRYGRTSLKIFYCGCLLNGPKDPAIAALTENFYGRNFLHLAENASRLADKIPFYSELDYATVQRVAPSLRPNVLSRLTDCHSLSVNTPVQNVQEFLDLLDSFSQIVKLEFLRDQPQNLFDQLPEHCDLQSLKIRTKPEDLQFLFRLPGLTHLNLGPCSVNVPFIRKALEELPFLCLFAFSFMDKSAEISKNWDDFEIRIRGGTFTMTRPCDRNAVMRFFCELAGEEYQEVKNKRRRVC